MIRLARAGPVESLTRFVRRFTKCTPHPNRHFIGTQAGGLTIGWISVFLSVEYQVSIRNFLFPFEPTLAFIGGDRFVQDKEISPLNRGDEPPGGWEIFCISLWPPKTPRSGWQSLISVQAFVGTNHYGSEPSLSPNVAFGAGFMPDAMSPESDQSRACFRCSVSSCAPAEEGSRTWRVNVERISIRHTTKALDYGNASTVGSSHSPSTRYFFRVVTVLVVVVTVALTTVVPNQSSFVSVLW